MDKLNELVLTCTDIKRFRMDPWRYFAQTQFNSIERAIPLDIGSLWHSFCEARVRGATLAQAQEQMNDALETTVLGLLGTKGTAAATKFRGQGKILLAASEHWEVPPCDEVLAIEEAIEVPLGLIPGTTCKLTLNIRPDLVIRVNGSLWHEQHRTLDKGVTMALYQRTAVRDITERLYHVGLKHRFPEEDVIGTRFDVLRKLRPESIHAAPRSALGRFEVVMEQPLIESAIRQLKGGIAKAIYLMRMGIIEIWDNDDLDRGKFGNSEDAFFKVLSGECELDDARYFEPVKDRYAELGAKP